MDRFLRSSITLGTLTMIIPVTALRVRRDIGPSPASLVVWCSSVAQGRIRTLCYLHPARDQVTYSISKLTDEQKTRLVDFLKTTKRAQGEDSEAAGCDEKREHWGLEGKDCPLPLLPNETNLHRVGPEEPLSMIHVHRQAWKREIPPPEWMGGGRASCVRNTIDFPTEASQGETFMRWRSRGDRR